jgi:hypothetical protein
MPNQNSLYDSAREAFLLGQIDWSTNTIRAVLVDTTKYTVSINGHAWLSDVSADARVATSAPFTSKTTTSGVANAAAAIFTSASGARCSALVIYRDTGTASTSRLIAYITSAAGLPVTPGGGAITVQFDTGANKIFKL